MSWSNKKNWLTILLAFFLGGCENPNEIGLEVDPNENNVEVAFIDLKLQNSVVLEDSINSTNVGQLVAGSYLDTKFGLVHAEAYTELRPSSLLPGIPEDAELDSAILNLRFSYHYGDDFNQIQSLGIYELRSEIASTNNFTSDSLLLLQKWGEVSFFSNPQTDTVLSIPVDVGKFPDDTLPIQFERDALFNLLKETEGFNSFTELSTIFPGIAIVPEKEDGAIFGFNPNDQSTRLAIYFSTPDDSVSSSFELLMGNGINSFSRINGDRSGTEIEGLDEFFESIIPPDDKFYLQAGTGVTGKINFDRLKEFTDSTENLVINRAELIVGPIEEFTEYLTPPLQLILSLTDSTNIVNRDPDLRINQILLNSPLLLTFDPEENTFLGLITGYVQLLATGDIDQTQFLLFPSNNVRTVNRFVTPSDKVFVKLFFTTFN